MSPRASDNEHHDSTARKHSKGSSSWGDSKSHSSLRHDSPARKHLKGLSSWGDSKSLSSVRLGTEDFSALNGTLNVSSRRGFCAWVLSHQYVETVLGFVIMSNMWVVIVDTDYRAANMGDDSRSWVVTLNMVYLCIYSIELLARLYAFRRSFFNNVWNLMDFSIISVDLMSVVLDGIVDMPKLTFLRVLRLAKLMRALRILLAFPELYLLVKGIFGALKAILWGSFLIFSMLTLFGIMAVELIHPINLRVVDAGVYDDCERCGRAFASVSNAVVTFMQTIVAGDGWGQVSIPVAEEQPISFFFFVSVYVVVGMGVMNLILAVVVDRAHESRQDDLERLAQMKESDATIAKKKLEKMCRDLDVDQRGSMSLEEFMSGYDRVPDFADTLRVMDIKRDDLPVVFHICDLDGSGEVDYEEFTEQLYNLRSHDMHTLVVFVRYYVMAILEQTRSLHSKLGLSEGGTGLTTARPSLNSLVGRCEAPGMPCKVDARPKQPEVVQMGAPLPPPLSVDMPLIAPLEVVLNDLSAEVQCLRETSKQFTLSLQDLASHVAASDKMRKPPSSAVVPGFVDPRGGEEAAYASGVPIANVGASTFAVPFQLDVVASPSLKRKSSWACCESANTQQLERV